MKHIVLAGLLAVFASPLWAQPETNARYIVEQTVNPAIFIGAMAALKPVIASAMENDLRAQGIEINDPGRFADLVFEEFLGEFTEGMQRQTLGFYLANFTPEQLEDIADFYATPSGQELIRQTPAMMQFGADVGRAIGQEAGRNAGPRIAKRLERENIVLTNDPGMMQRLIDALR